MISRTLENSLQRSLQLWIRTYQIIFNCILALIAKGGTSVSVLSKTGFFDEWTLLDHYENINCNVFLACSIMLGAIAWLGIFAGMKNCHKSSRANGQLLGLFLLGTISYIITMGVITDYTQEGHLYNQMQNEMARYDKHNKIIDKLQNTLSCCGLNDVTTWNVTNFPKSCCSNNRMKCALGTPYLQTNGCFKELIRTLRYYVWLLFVVFVFCGLFEILGITSSHLQRRTVEHADVKKLAKKSLKIPRPRTTSTVELDVQGNEENKNQEESKDAKETAERSEEAGTSTDKKANSAETEEHNTCRNICKDITHGRVNINS